jgi:hypothetical protein
MLSGFPLLTGHTRQLLQQWMCDEGCELNSVAPGSCVFDGTTGFTLCKACKQSTGKVPAADGSCGE